MINTGLLNLQKKNRPKIVELRKESCTRILCTSSQKNTMQLNLVLTGINSTTCHTSIVVVSMFDVHI